MLANINSNSQTLHQPQHSIVPTFHLGMYLRPKALLIWYRRGRLGRYDSDTVCHSQDRKRRMAVYIPPIFRYAPSKTLEGDLLWPGRVTQTIQHVGTPHLPEKGYHHPLWSRSDPVATSTPTSDTRRLDSTYTCWNIPYSGHI